MTRPGIRLPTLVLACAGVLISACGGVGAGPEKLVGKIETMPFKRLVVDADPPGGRSCCTDVAALGDIDGDGDLDLLVGAEQDPGFGLVWYEFPNWSRHPIGQGDFTTDGLVVDIDRDGDADVVTSSHDPPDISWWENTIGAAGKRTWTRRRVGDMYAHDLVVADLDGDGRLDIVKSAKGGTGGWFGSPSDHSEVWTFHEIGELVGEGIAAGDVDHDGDIDLASGRLLFQNVGGSFVRHAIADDWGSDTRTRLADVDADGRLDVVLSHSESEGRVSWFRNSGSFGRFWDEFVVGSAHEGVHSLQVTDFDLDGDLDVLVGEMHTSSSPRLLLYEHEEPDRWIAHVLSTSGTHNAQVGDVDGDGDVDIVGKKYAGSYRPIEWWENLAADLLEARNWSYVGIDSERPPDQRGKLGLVFADVNSDGLSDVVSGSLVYRNPGGMMLGSWDRVRLPDSVDVIFAEDVDGDPYADLIGVNDAGLLWIEAADRSAATWNRRLMAALPPGRTQGYTTAQIYPGGPFELIFTRGRRLFLLELPAREANPQLWSIRELSSENQEEGVDAGDMDGDGDIDLALVFGDGREVGWLDNPGRRDGRWTYHAVGRATWWLDRIAIGDVNGDGLPDVVATEETPDWQFNASVYWFEAPARPTLEIWKRTRITTLRSVNSMQLFDMDGDGDLDVVAAEHTDQRGRDGAFDNLTLILENRDSARRWISQVVEIGRHSSHLGARIADLDEDGAADLVSPAWNQYQLLHLWRNDSERSVATK